MIHITWKNEQEASLSVAVIVSIAINVVAFFGQFLLRNQIAKHTERWILMIMKSVMYIFKLAVDRNES